MFPLKDDIPTLRVPIVTMVLIAANAAAFLWQLSFGLERSVMVGGAIPYEILSFRDVGPPDLVAPPLTILTSMFLHGGYAHIGGNMWFLWIFGNNVEDALGRGRFLLFYFVGGVVAALSQAFVTATAGGDTLVPMVGASGAIAGVLAGYMVLFPRARVLTLIFIIIIVRLVYLPASLFIGFWFATQLLAAFAGAGGGGGSGVAFMAHVGGFVAGFVLVKLMGPMRSYRRPFPR